MTPETEFLGRVTVRLIVAEERDRFDELLEEKHYLKSARVGDRASVTWPKPRDNGWR